MFRKTVTHSGGISEDTASERHAYTLLGGAVRRGYAIDFTPQGGITMAWTWHLFGPDGTAVATARQIDLAPELPVRDALTVTTRGDLELVGLTRGVTYDPETRTIHGGLWSIPQGATARLRARQLVTVADDNTVRVSLTAHVGQHARDHATTTTTPEGWHHPDPKLTAGLNKPGRRAGLTYDGGSAAVCPCGYTRHAEDRTEARRLATAHRLEEAAEFARSLTATA